MRIRQLSWLVLVLSLVVAAARLSPVRGQSANLLINPGFEGDYKPFDNDAERLVADGWTPWNVSRNAGESSWVNVKPQYQPSEAQGRVHGGQRSQELLTFYAIFTGGVYQKVNVTPGTPLRFSTQINVWSTNLDDPARSEQPSRVSVQVGIDPTGGTDASSAAVVWGSSQTFYDEFRELAVTAQAAGQTVTVFVRAIFLDPQRHNHIYVDDAVLATTTEPVPTNVTLPSATPTFTPSVKPSSTPTSTATFTPSAKPPVTTAAPSFVPPTQEGTIVSPTPSNTPGGPTVNAPTPEGPGTTVPTVPGDFSDLQGRVEYIVRSGDTVGDLALRYNSRVDAIISLNKLNNDGLIVVGQRLIIPVPLPTPTNTLSVPTIAPTAVGPTPTPVGGVPAKPPVESAVLDGPTVNGIGTYIMQPGDTLAAVAKRYNISLQELARLNGIVNAARVVIGQVLAVPGPGNNRPGGTVAPTIIPTVPGTSAGGTYVVQRGDNLFRIALRFGVTLQTLQRLNNISNPALIYVGQVLKIP